jgi:hypothetical protein
MRAYRDNGNTPQTTRKRSPATTISLAGSKQNDQLLDGIDRDTDDHDHNLQ